MYLRVEMPSKPTSKVGSSDERTRAKLGRRVAALFGMAGGPEDGDAGGGRRWLGSYSAMTMTELLLGGPLVRAPKSPDIEDLGVFSADRQGRKTEPVVVAVPEAGLGAVTAESISPTVTNGYQPGPQSAVTLLGVNAVLEPLTNALVTVLREMVFPDTRLLVGTTSMLLSEAFRSQPLLILAGVQASRIQQALRLEDQVLVLAEPPAPQAPWRCSRLDLPRVQLERRDNPQTRTPPLFLDLIQQVWAALVSRPGTVRLEPQQTNRVEIEQPFATSQISLPEESALAAAHSLTERVVFGLGGGAAGTHIVVRREPDGTFGPDFIGVATRPARILVDRVVGNHFVDDSELENVRRVDSRRGNVPADAGAPTSPVPSFNVERWRPESTLVQRVALWAHHCAERFVVSGAWSVGEPHAATLDTSTEQRRILAQAAADLLGYGDPLTVQLRIFHHSYRLEHARRTRTRNPATPVDHEDLEQLVDDFHAAIETMTDLNAGGAVLDSHLVESLQPTLMDLAALCDVIGELVPSHLSAKFLDILRRYWGTYLRVQLSLLESPSVARSHDEILHALAADGAWNDPVMSAMLESSPALAASVSLYHPNLDLAIRIHENSRRRRAAIYEVEDDWPPYRQSLIYEGLLKLRRYQASHDDIVRNETIKQVADIVETTVATELNVHNIMRKNVTLRPGLPEDALLLTLAEYLDLHAEQPHPSREGSGFQHQIESALRGRYRDCTRRRLAAPLWNAEPLQPYRDTLLKLLDRNLDKPDPHTSTGENDD